MRLPEFDPGRSLIAIAQTYDNPVIRLCSRVRFRILRRFFLEEIDPYLPAYRLRPDEREAARAAYGPPPGAVAEAGFRSVARAMP